jgi:hypothetical protein
MTNPVALMPGFIEGYRELARNIGPAGRETTYALAMADDLRTEADGLDLVFRRKLASKLREAAALIETFAIDRGVRS